MTDYAKGYARWDGGNGQLGAMMERHAINNIEYRVRAEFQTELSTGQPIPDSVLQDMRRATAPLLADAKKNEGVWRQVGWWRDPTDPTRVIMYA
jgi:hypothetical protein